MNRKAKRSFVLKNLKSRFVKPAVFAVEYDTPEDENKSDVIREAESIIDSYLKKMGYDGVTARPHARKSGAVFAITVILCAMAAIYLIVRFM